MYKWARSRLIKENLKSCYYRFFNVLFEAIGVIGSFFYQKLHFLNRFLSSENIKVSRNSGEIILVYLFCLMSKFVNK